MDRREALRRLDAIDLTQPTPAPLPGQQAIPVGTVWDHVYEGPGPCHADLFGQRCGKHRDEHQHLDHKDTR
ncbi:hypothetical protein [Streptomyces sp. NPDC003395]